MKKIIISISSILFLFSSCLNNDYLERLPLDQQTEETAFSSYENFQTYAWQFYTYLEADAGPTSLDAGPNSTSIFDCYSDNGFFGSPNNENPWVWQTVTVPSTTSDWDTPYTRIRAINILLDNIDTSSMTDEEKNHWRSVGYFFKANEYYRLIAYFGSAIWVEHALQDTDTDVLYSARMPREELAAKVLEMLEYAKDHIQINGDGDNTINRDVVLALISRFGLFEGTWQKYHGISNGEAYLQASFEASNELIAAAGKSANQSSETISIIRPSCNCYCTVVLTIINNSGIFEFASYTTNTSCSICDIAIIYTVLNLNIRREPYDSTNTA